MADLGLGFLVGSGRMTILVGGVEASTNDDTFVDPFGEFVPLRTGHDRCGPVVPDGGRRPDSVDGP